MSEAIVDTDACSEVCERDRYNGLRRVEEDEVTSNSWSMTSAKTDNRKKTTHGGVGANGDYY